MQRNIHQDKSKNEIELDIELLEESLKELEHPEQHLFEEALESE